MLLGGRVSFRGEQLHGDLDPSTGVALREVADPGEETSLHPLLVKRARSQKPKPITVLASGERADPCF
jgi:hypothetical protein